MGTHLLDYCGKENLKKFFGTGMGKNIELGMLVCEKRIDDHWKVDVTKNIQKDICGPGEADKNSSNHQTCEFVA